MKIAIIGGGASGVYASILLKSKFINDEVTIFEATDKLLNKVKASGNGRCNIDNLNDDAYIYNNPDFLKAVLSAYPIDKQLQTLNSFDIYVKELLPSYLYPISENSLCVKTILEKKLYNLGINVKFNYELTNYKETKAGIKLFFQNNEEIICDRLIFAIGTPASLKINHVEGLMKIFMDRGYDISLYRSGLCPIKVKENLKPIFGQRLKCEVKAYVGKKLIYDDFGEVMFKKDALSGIVIFNLSSVISRNNYKDIKIFLKPLNDENLEILRSLYKKDKCALYSFFSLPLSDYFLNRAKKENKDAPQLVENIEFTYLNNYPLIDAQVAIGGINLNNLDKKMMSKKENNVYFIGEGCNIDGYCGGYNLKWCLVSAIKLSENFR